MTTICSIKIPFGPISTMSCRSALELDEDGFSPVAVCDLGHRALTRHWPSVPNHKNFARPYCGALAALTGFKNCKKFASGL